MSHRRRRRHPADGTPPVVPGWPGTAAGGVICRGTSIYLVTTDELYPADRLEKVREAAGAAGLDAVLLTPGPDLRYVIGYDAKQLERLTCLAVPADADPVLFVPRLELAAAQASPAGALDLEMVPWEETDDPFALVAARLGSVSAVGLSDRMWALSVLQFRDALPGARLALAGGALRTLRIRKSPAEVAALREAGAAIDRVHAQVAGWLRPGLTERAVGSVIAESILAEGHATVDFVIVGSGPNAASPHHEVSDRVMDEGDVVVVDIGGTMPSGYCSDSTRTYALGEPPAEFTAYYKVLYDAQEAACAAVRPGVTAESVDAAGPGAHHPGGLRRCLHPPDRARHRARGPRGPLHRGGQPRAAGAGHGVLGRAGHLPRPARGADRGHRGLHRGPAPSG